MSLTNAVYNFAVNLRDSADILSPLYQAVVHADAYEEMKAVPGTQFIRIDDLLASTPLPSQREGEFKEFNAYLDVQFVRIPINQTLAERLIAAEKNNQAAFEFVKAVYSDQKLGTNDCQIIQSVSIQKRNSWALAGNRKSPASVLRLAINKK